MRALFPNIISIYKPATIQSSSLGRESCVKDTLAENYRAASYNVDYSGHISPSGDQRQVHHSYDSSAFHESHRPHHEQGQQHHHSHQHTHQHLPTTTYQRHVAAEGGLPQMQEAGNDTPQNQSAMAQQQSPNTSAQMLISPGIGSSRNDRIASNPFGGHGSLIAPLYPEMTQPHRSTATSPLQSRKRPPPEEFDSTTSGLPDLQHSSLDSMTQATVGAPYTHATATGGMMSAPDMSMTHHHHHLPNIGPSSKVMRREDSGMGMPSMVGQEGMPPPAPRPRGPKLKFTAEDDQLLILLKEQKNLTWKQIADFFPGRSSGTLQVRYCTKLKAKTTLWTEEMVSYEKQRGRNRWYFYSTC